MGNRMGWTGVKKKSEHGHTIMTRRRFHWITGGALTSFALDAVCPRHGIPAPADSGRLTARPRAHVTTSAQGQSALGLGSGRDGILQVPSTSTGGPLPLLLLFHGAGGSAQGVLGRLGSVPGEAGIAVLAPESRASTWDAIRSGFGPDVRFVNRALERVFDTVAVDPARIAIGGFSDGATYALSLGLINGDLFPRIVAFSPGFVTAGTPHGTPRIFVSHGNADPILPIERCSRRIVSDLRRSGYDVTFREFTGGHELPPDIARAGMNWIIQGTG
jgi:phospholipase/carboxylesterase